jgi:histidine triad (HIT) family protein
MDCLFCKIIKGEIPSKKLYEDDVMYAFHDINPQAPVHFLAIPKEHIASLDEISAENAAKIAHIARMIPELARMAGIQNGYRVITNVGEDGCQSVKHLHFHVIGGAKLSEQMA